MTVTLRQTHPDDWDGSLGGHGDETLTREPWPYECACGADYGPDIAKAGYPAWHQPNIRTNRFLDECSVESCHGKRVCHECSTRCKICGRLFCPDCTTEDIKTFGLCENCIGVYSEIEAGPIREKLIEVECRLGGQYSNQGYYRSHGMDEDLTKVLEIAKTALVSVLHEFNRKPSVVEGADILLTALRRIEAGCAFPADEVQKTVRDVARTAISEFESKPFESTIPVVLR